MDRPTAERANPALLLRYARRRLAPNRADIVSALLIGGGVVLVAHGAQQMGAPLSSL